MLAEPGESAIIKLSPSTHAEGGDVYAPGVAVCQVPIDTQGKFEAEAGYHLPGDVLNNYLEAVDAYLL